MPESRIRNLKSVIASNRDILTGPVCLALCFLSLGCIDAFSQKESREKKDDAKKGETLKIKRLTQGMGLYATGPLSPDRRQLILIAAKPERAPNLYVMDVSDFSISRGVTEVQWGVSDPVWSPDGSLIAFAGNSDTGSFSEVYTVDPGTGRLRRITANSFTDKEPVFTPDGNRLLLTTDESPLPDAAFGILHIVSVPVTGGKPEYFTEDEVSSIKPGISPDGKGVLIVKVDELSGRHSLWLYGFDGAPQRNLSSRKFARIHQYIPVRANNTIVLWAQQEAEQQENLYILDAATGEVKELPVPELIKRNPTVSPDGSLIGFVGPTGAGTHVFLFDSATGQIEQLTYKGFNTHSPVFVSDKLIVFGSDRDKTNEVYVIDITPVEEKAKVKK